LFHIVNHITSKVSSQFVHKFLKIILRNSRESVVKAMDLDPASLGLIPVGTHMSHWWRQEGHPSKIAPAHQ